MIRDCGPRQVAFPQLGIDWRVGEHQKDTAVPSGETVNDPEAVGLAAGLGPMGVGTPVHWRVAGRGDERTVSPPAPLLRWMPVGLGPALLSVPVNVILLTVRLPDASMPWPAGPVKPVRPIEPTDRQSVV